ncbi:MAG TPA: hypothetical protein VN964_03050 [Gemmatimonadales bacterium]|nr:hypothetical protein [Gemmatimonadales bacterium]
MKTLRLALLAAVALGCHFDKLFQPSGGVRASRAGSQASQLRFTTQPHSTMKDSIIPPVQVTAFDSAGNVVTSFTGNVKVAIGHGAVLGDANLTGTTTVAAVNGVATYANLRIDQIGTGYTLTATATPLAGDTSNPFDITATPTPGPATKLAFVGQPTNTSPGATISPPVRVAAVDDQNNIVTTFSGSITIAIGHNGGLLKPGTLGGTLLQPAVNGVAIFTDLSIDQAGTDYYTLRASHPQLGTMESAPFSVLVP